MYSRETTATTTYKIVIYAQDIPNHESCFKSHGIFQSRFRLFLISSFLLFLLISPCASSSFIRRRLLNALHIFFDVFVIKNNKKSKGMSQRFETRRHFGLSRPFSQSVSLSFLLFFLDCRFHPLISLWCFMEEKKNERTTMSKRPPIDDSRPNSLSLSLYLHRYSFPLQLSVYPTL